MDILKDWNKELSTTRQRLSKLRERAERVRTQAEASATAEDRREALESKLETLAEQRQQVKSDLLETWAEGDAVAESKLRAEMKHLDELASDARAEIEALEAPEVDEAEHADLAAALEAFKAPDYTHVLNRLEAALSEQAGEIVEAAQEARELVPGGYDQELYSAARERHDPLYRSDMQRERGLRALESERREKMLRRANAALAEP